MTTRADLPTMLHLDASSPTKTFVIEVHPADDPVALLHRFADEQNIHETDDAYLYQVLVDGTDYCFWVDQLDDRFWSFHTEMPATTASRYLKQRINSNWNLDWMWLPSEFLHNIWPGTPVRGANSKFEGTQLLGEQALVDDVKLKLSGRSASVFLDYLYNNAEIKASVPFDAVEIILDDPDFGYIHEAVDRSGRFVASGNSLEFHLQFVQTVVERYKRVITLCEEKALGWTSFDRSEVEEGGQMLGEPLGIRFTRTIPSLEDFVGSLFSSRGPFRLWGAPRFHENSAEVEAVDLHVGQRLSVDIGVDWMRIYLARGSCGNSLARLATNLQHSFDGALTFTDPAIQAALEGRADRSPELR